MTQLKKEQRQTRRLSYYQSLWTVSYTHLVNSLLHDKLKKIYLGHLSKENNYDKLAYETVKLEIDMSDNSFKSSDFDIEVAKRDVLSGICEI